MKNRLYIAFFTAKKWIEMDKSPQPTLKFEHHGGNVILCGSWEHRGINSFTCLKTQGKTKYAQQLQHVHMTFLKKPSALVSQKKCCYLP